MGNIISVKDLVVDYDISDTNDDKENSKEIKTAVNGLSIDIKEGEYICILGRNGGGKSTFVKVLNGLIEPTSGTVLVCGNDISNKPNSELLLNVRKNVGMVFQNPDNGMVASLVEEDIAFALENIGVESKEIRRRIDETMKKMGIYDLRNETISHLSGGQKQKVALAGVLSLKPKVIILDEPTSMLDKKARVEILNIVRDLNKIDGITIIFITHYVDEIYDSDRVIVIDEGQIVMEAPYKELFLKKEELEKHSIILPYIPRFATEINEMAMNKNLFKGNETTIFEIKERLNSFNGK